MKICFLTDTVFLHGGVARVVTTLANNLSKNHEVTVICCDNSHSIQNNIYNLDLCNVKVVFIELDKTIKIPLLVRLIRKVFRNNPILYKIIPPKYTSLFVYPLQVRNKLEKFLDNKYDSVIGIHTYYSMLLGVISPKINCKTFGWQHNSYQAYFETPNKYIWRQERFYKYCIEQLDANVVLTDDDREKHKRYLGMNSIKINNPNSFSTNKISSLQNKKFLSVGRLVEQKGFDLLIEAFSEFNKKNKEWKLIIVGEGPKYEELNELINKYDLQEYVEIKKFTENIIDYYINSSVYVLSSRFEGWGLTWLEAMLCGLPIVGFDLPACSEVVQNKNVGIFVEMLNVKALGNAMLSIVEFSNLEQMSKNSIHVAKKYTPDNIVKIWEKMLSTSGR